MDLANTKIAQMGIGLWNNYLSGAASAVHHAIAGSSTATVSSVWAKYGVGGGSALSIVGVVGLAILGNRMIHADWEIKRNAASAHAIKILGIAVLLTASVGAAASLAVATGTFGFAAYGTGAAVFVVSYLARDPSASNARNSVRGGISG